MDLYENGDNIDNTRLQKFLKDQFEMLLQEVDKFGKTTVPDVQHSMDTSDFVKSFADYPMSSNNSNISENALSEYKKLLQDFHELESTMIPMHQKDTLYDLNSINTNLTGTAQNPEPTIILEKKKPKNVSTWGLNDATGVAQTTDNIGGCPSTQDRGTAATMSTATYINSSGNGISSRGGMFTSLVNFANVSCFGFTGSIKSTGATSRIAAWRQGGVKEVPKHRHKRRRRYRGVYQTEEEARLKQERLKIKQRATSAEAYQKKKDYITMLEEQVQRLREQNKRQKTSVMLLRSNSLVNLPLRPLKRTFSGPI